MRIAYHEDGKRKFFEKAEDVSPNDLSCHYLLAQSFFLSATVHTVDFPHPTPFSFPFQCELDLESQYHSRSTPAVFFFAVKVKDKGFAEGKWTCLLGAAFRTRFTFANAPLFAGEIRYFPYNDDKETLPAGGINFLHNDIVIEDSVCGRPALSFHNSITHPPRVSSLRMTKTKTPFRSASRSLTCSGKAASSRAFVCKHCLSSRYQRSWDTADAASAGIAGGPGAVTHQTRFTKPVSPRCVAGDCSCLTRLRSTPKRPGCRRTWAACSTLPRARRR